MPLDKHLIAHTKPHTNKKNIILWKNYRISVLQDRLFRIERNSEKIFRDEATQTVWFRNMTKQEFEVKKNNEYLLISTSKCQLLIKEKRKDCRVIVNNIEKEIVNTENLKGTYRTLDGCDGDTFIYLKEPIKIKLSNGVCSKNGVAFFDDVKSYSLDENGELLPIQGKGIDEYVFVYGHDYKDAVNALYMITGNVPMVPRFSLGNWWSRYHAYSDKEYLRLLEKFEEHDAPLTVATIDMDWHYSNYYQIDKDFKVSELNRKNEEYLGVQKDMGWTGYTWNKYLFKDYKAFLKEIEKKNLKITLNLHPAGGIRYWDECYKDMADAMDIDYKSEKCVDFDIFDSKFINAYFSIVHKPYEKEGVSFWWIDWQQGTKWGKNKIDPLWSLNHYHYLDNSLNHKTPLILSRYSGIGSHRYPLGFSGDTSISWKTLKYLPYFTLTASNIGYTWWSHDIGGHHMGEMDEQLYLRSIQYGVFSPINRMHCTSMLTITKEPWAYNNGCGALAVEWLKIRHKMIPFLYSFNYKTSKEGKALVEPLYYYYSENKEAYEKKDEYFFGDLLVNPISEKTKKDGYAHVKVWIPEGKWTDIFTLDEYEAPKGGIYKVLYRKLESIPVLAKSGSIIPMSLDKGNSVLNPTKLEINIFNGNGKFVLYEDNSEKNRSGEFFTTFESENIDNNTQILYISSKGNKNVIPTNRTLRIAFKNILNNNCKVKVFENEQEVEFIDIFDDYVMLEIKFNAKSNYKITVNYTDDKVYKTKERIRKLLLQCEDNNNNKSKLYDEVYYNAKTVEDCILMVKNSLCRNSTKNKLLEIFND